jgi:hypothetical protein
VKFSLDAIGLRAEVYDRWKELGLPGVVGAEELRIASKGASGSRRSCAQITLTDLRIQRQVQGNTLSWPTTSGENIFVYRGAARVLKTIRLRRPNIASDRSHHFQFQKRNRPKGAASIWKVVFRRLEEDHATDLEHIETIEARAHPPTFVDHSPAAIEANRPLLTYRIDIYI